MFRRRKNPLDLMSQFDSMFENFGSMFSSMDSNPFVIGEVKTETGSDENGDWTKQTFNSEDGSLSITNFIRTNLKNTKKQSDKVSTLKSKLETAVEKQDFEEAVKLRDEIKKLEKNKDKINSLKSDLDKAIKEQDFEKAIDLRDKLKSFE